MGLMNILESEIRRVDEEKKNRKEIVNLYEKAWQEEVICSECSTWHSKEDNYCMECGHKLKKITNDEINKKYCPICGERVNIGDNYCGNYGHKIETTRTRKCDVCGEWIGEERYCINCGHDTIERNPMFLLNNNRLDLRKPKKCPNCGRKHQRFFNYCHLCGEKLIRYK